jgi:hypothetical protein
VLKSKWLDGKRNCRVDYLIHTLVRDLLPDIEDCHKWQERGMEREDLAGRRRHEIQARAPETPLDYITQVEDTCFQVHSSNKEKVYEVDLLNEKCTCFDFPRIEFCKHIASVRYHFGGAEPQARSAPQPSPIAPVLHDTDGGNAAHNENTMASVISVTNEIIALSQKLLMDTPNPEAASNIVKSLRLVRSHLAAVVMSATSDGPQLPEKEQIAPNQHSWTETAKRMGVKRGNPSRGKVDSTQTAKRIGEINRKCNCEDEDPYGAGEQSGKSVKPNAHSVTANARAHATMEPPAASPRPPPPSLPPRLSHPSAPGPIPQMPQMHYYVPPLPLSQPASSPASALPPPSLPLSHPPHLSARVPNPFPSYPPPFLSQPAPVPQFIQYQYPGFPMPYALYYPPNR